MWDQTGITIYEERTLDQEDINEIKYANSLALIS